MGTPQKAVSLSTVREIPKNLILIAKAKPPYLHSLPNKYLLADRGQGLLRTLQRVKLGLKTHEEALKVAFTEIVSGRAPESRGNGLKFVRKIIANDESLSLIFQTGDASLNLGGKSSELHIGEKTPDLHGCIAILNF